MIEKIITFIENSNVYSLMKDMERVLLQPKPRRTISSTLKPAIKMDPYEILKAYNLELIKGIGPKTKLKLEQFGIKSVYDLVYAEAIQGFSKARVDTWKESALLLH